MKIPMLKIHFPDGWEEKKNIHITPNPVNSRDFRFLKYC
jgi:hypothetical protein